MQATITESTVVIEQKPSESNLKVADAVWLATAALHRALPENEDFLIAEIENFIMDFRLTKAAKNSVRLHISQHCVANRKPRPNRSCMLFAPSETRRRLFRLGDLRDPGREGAPTHPRWDLLPEAFSHMRKWYEGWIGTPQSLSNDPLLQLIGHGSQVWDGTDADSYVSRLRQEWAS